MVKEDLILQYCLTFIDAYAISKNTLDECHRLRALPLAPFKSSNPGHSETEEGVSTLSKDYL